MFYTGKASTSFVLTGFTEALVPNKHEDYHATFQKLVRNSQNSKPDD